MREGSFELTVSLQESKFAFIPISVHSFIPLFTRQIFWVRASLVAQLVKNLPGVRETWVQSLDWEDLLEKGKATHSSLLAWRIPWTV